MELFSNIDNERQAYFLGFIFPHYAPSKHWTVSVDIEDHDLYVDFVTFFGSKVTLERCHGLLIFTPTKDLNNELLDLFDNVEYDGNTLLDKEVLPSEMILPFLRGVLDSVGQLDQYNKHVSCRIPFRCLVVTELVQAKYGHLLNGYGLLAKDTNAVDLLADLYDDATVSSKSGRSFYHNIVFGFTQNHKLVTDITLTDPRAVMPSKARASDSGFDVTVISIVKTVGDVTFFNTGLQVKPPHGWYFDLVPRSSLAKTGWMFANSTGIIDRAYRGNILVPMRCVDPTRPELELPARIGQLIPRPIVHMVFNQQKSLSSTSRGDGGFGSTG